MSATTRQPAPIHAQLAFAKPSDVQDDAERPGMLRAVTHPINADPMEVSVLERCRLRDWSGAAKPELDLSRMGFDCIDLSLLDRLQVTLAGVREAGEVTDADASAIRRELKGRSFALSTGKRLRLLVIAAEGFIMRKAGPNGIAVVPNRARKGMNGHDGALTVHADQDVHGTPLKQMMRGAAPWLFRHRSPDGSNPLSPLCLVNIWIPLQQVARPLALMDRRTLDSRRHQLRYALPTDTFLERDESQRMNDIWKFLHDDAQDWYFGAELDSKRAYVFDTLGTPHGSVVLPGEDVAAHLYRQLREARTAFDDRDVGGLRAATGSAPPALHPDATAPLRQAIADMETVLADARACAERADFSAADWPERAERATDRVVRKSLEMRAVAVLTPDVWPFNRS